MARAWEASNCLPSLYGGKGMGAQKAAWQAAFTAEAAALSKLEHAQALLDLVKAFETVPHWILVLAAIARLLLGTAQIIFGCLPACQEHWN